MSQLRQPNAPNRHDCIVVGAGLLGLSAARAMAQRGLGVMVLDAAPPGHERAGSKGSARIFRLGYPDPLYVDMAVRSLDLWRDLEAESGRRLLSITGQVSFGPQLARVATALRDLGLESAPLTEAEATTRFPALWTGGSAIYEPLSGVLAADRCLQALHDDGQFALRTDAPVVGLEDAGGAVEVHLQDGESLAADVVIVCAGHHSVGLLEGLHCPPARPPTLQQVLYIAAETTHPVFIEWGEQMIYGLPVPGRALYKVAQHLPAAPFDDANDLDHDDPDQLSTLLDVVRRLLPGLDPTPVATERCLYDNTVDEDFILDRVGRVVIGCGTSGHGFKFGPLLGELLADLATGSTPPIDLTRFSASRSSPASPPTP